MTMDDSWSGGVDRDFVNHRLRVLFYQTGKNPTADRHDLHSYSPFDLF
jgi:hypothetical protein